MYKAAENRMEAGNIASLVFSIAYVEQKDIDDILEYVEKSDRELFFAISHLTIVESFLEIEEVQNGR